MIHYRRNPDEALRLANMLEPDNAHLLYLDDGEVSSNNIDYRRDSLLEIHEKLCKRKISSTSPGEI